MSSQPGRSGRARPPCCPSHAPFHAPRPSSRPHTGTRGTRPCGVGPGEPEEGTLGWAPKGEGAGELGETRSVGLSRSPASAPGPGLQVCPMRQSEEASLGSPRSDALMLGLFFSLPSAPPPGGLSAKPRPPALPTPRPKQRGSLLPVAGRLRGRSPVPRPTAVPGLAPSWDVGPRTPLPAPEVAQVTIVLRSRGPRPGDGWGLGVWWGWVAPRPPLGFPAPTAEGPWSRGPGLPSPPAPRPAPGYWSCRPIPKSTCVGEERAPGPRPQARPPGTASVQGWPDCQSLASQGCLTAQHPPPQPSSSLPSALSSHVPTGPAPPGPPR